MRAKSATKRIGINTIFLFGRKVVTLFIAFYTSRLLLEKLGVDDFGLYGLVGSIVAIFSALRGLFSTSIQRFINVAKGKSDFDKVNRIFSIGLKIHVWIAICFALIVEIGGLIILPTLNIPSESYIAAIWILQFSILTTIVSILTVPYDALIIANEKFGVYAILSIVESILKLLIVVALSLCKYNRVIYYTGLLFVVSLLIRLANSIYCRYAFGNESKYNNVKDPTLLKEMTSFAGWQFCGNMGFALTNSGVNIVLNIFGGVAVNAARTIAYQVNNAVTQFIGDINVSFQPRCMMQYSSGDMKGFWQLFYLNSKSSFSISIIIAFPILMTTPFLLKIWLGEIPEFSVVFLRWIMIYMVIRSVHGPIDMLFKSEGKLKWYQLTELCIMVLNIPISWIALKEGAPYWFAFAVMNILEIINLFAILILSKVQVSLDLGIYIKKLLIRIIFVCIILASIYYFAMFFLLSIDNLESFILIFAMSILMSVSILFSILFTKQERIKVLKLLYKKKTLIS